MTDELRIKRQRLSRRLDEIAQEVASVPEVADPPGYSAATLALLERLGGESRDIAIAIRQIDSHLARTKEATDAHVPS